MTLRRPLVRTVRSLPLHRGAAPFHVHKHKPMCNARTCMHSVCIVRVCLATAILVVISNHRNTRHLYYPVCKAMSLWCARVSATCNTVIYSYLHGYIVVMTMKRFACQCVGECGVNRSSGGPGERVKWKLTCLDLVLVFGLFTSQRFSVL